MLDVKTVEMWLKESDERPGHRFRQIQIQEFLHDFDVRWKI